MNRLEPRQFVRRCADWWPRLLHAPARDEADARGAEPVFLDALVRQSDIVSLHCPWDSSTLNLFDAPRFAAMKQGALFISTARGGIHDEFALAEVFRSRHLGGAGLDVWNPEPPPREHPLLARDNVVATFHTAGVSHEGRHNVAAMAAEQSHPRHSRP